MDWLRQVPFGQFVDARSGEGGGWLRRLDPRLKLAWTVAFLMTPVLAGPVWRFSLVALLLLVTLCSGLALRLWWRSVLFLAVLALLVGLLACFLPTGSTPSHTLLRPPAEIRLEPGSPGAAPPERAGRSWEILRLGPWSAGPFSLGPFVITRRSAELGVNSATLLFTLIHSANLLLITTVPEALVWGISWWLRPLGAMGWPMERLGFTLLLSLRFLPLVQEELQNLLRSIATRAVSLKQLGWKAASALVLGVGERLLANVLLRSEQGAQALLARGGRWLPPDQLHQAPAGPRLSTAVGAAGLLALLALRWAVGTH
jgi:energy-coupling factor transport system permease protein